MSKDSYLKDKNKTKKTTTTKRKKTRKSRAEFFTKRSKTLGTYRMSIQKIEKDIEEMECQLHNNNLLLIKASQEQNGQDISRLSKSTKQLRIRIDNHYKELEEINEEFELKKAEFDREENDFLNVLDKKK